MIAKLYRGINREEPRKHRQFIDGTVRLVNDYTTHDLDIIADCIRSHFRK